MSALAIGALGLSARNRASLGELVAIDRLAVRRRSAIVHPSPPTVTWSATAPDATYQRGQAWKTIARPAGYAPVWNNTLIRLDGYAAGAYMGFEVSHTGRYLAFGWTCAAATKERVLILVDGQPIAVPITPSVATVFGTVYYGFIDFGSDGTRRVEVLVTSAAAIQGVYWKITDGAVAPTPPRRRLFVVGDSFVGGSGALGNDTFRPDAQIAQALDIDVGGSAVGGTGYLTAGSFLVYGDAARVARAAAFDPHDILFIGSVNDSTANQATLTAAAAAAWADYKAACPDARLTVMGVQPSNATDTLSAGRFANNAALHDAAIADPNVERFVDLIGNCGVAPVGAWTSGVTYQPGDKVTRLGAVWQLDMTSAYSDTSFFTSRWRLLTGIYGTGRVGATASDGNRDLLLHSDGIHPTEKGCAHLARRMIEAVYG